MSPYRTAPARPVPPRRSWWTTARRVWAASKRRRPVDFASVRPTVAWLHGLAAFALLVGGHPLLAILVVVPALMTADGPNDVLRVLWRWRAVRRATRTWSTRCLHRESGCHTCGAAPGEPCDADTHMLAESHSMTDWEVAAIRRDNRIATRHARTTGVSTTFPAITAYRRLVHAPPEDAFEVDVEREDTWRGRAR